MSVWKTHAFSVMAVAAISAGTSPFSSLSVKSVSSESCENLSPVVHGAEGPVFTCPF